LAAAHVQSLLSSNISMNTSGAGPLGSAREGILHWRREEVQSEALVQEGNIRSILEHLSGNYFRKYGKLATPDDLKVWEMSLRSMRVDCTQVRLQRLQ
jgi:hypothetical protein